MKQFFALLIAACTLLTLSGCSGQEESVFFYYVRSEFLPGAADGVIAAEPREVTGERGFNYTLRLYLEGPVSDQYVSPFPSGLRLLSTKQEQDVAQVFLSEEFSALEDIDLTVACVCLANTCFALADVQQVQIITSSPEEDQVITLDKDSFALQDSFVLPDTTE